MQAVKWFDPVVGVDAHLVIVPGSPTPVVVPHPFIGVVFDPMGACFDALKELLVESAAHAFLGGDRMQINAVLSGFGMVPVGRVGTGVEGVKHIPLGVAFAPIDVPGNEGSIVSGSQTVEWCGDPAARFGSLVSSCSFPVNLPTSVCLPISIGPPVLIGGPEGVSLFEAAKQGIKTRWVAQKASALFKAKPGTLRSKAICFLTGDPVDIVTGAVLASAVDFTLPGPLPLSFERSYCSRSPHAGALGQGWSHPLEAAVREEEDGLVVQLEDGRRVPHPRLRVGASDWEPAERYTLTRAGEDAYRLEYTTGRALEFAGVPGIAGTCLLVQVKDRDGAAIRAVHEAGRLVRVIDSAGRTLRLHTDASGRLLGVDLEAEGAARALVRYAYDARGQLAAAHDAAGRATRYAYRGGVLVRETDRNGFSFHFEYDWDDPDGWCVRAWGDDGLYARTLTYDKHRRFTLVVDSRGGHTHYFGNHAGLVDRVLDAEGGDWRYEWHRELLCKTAEVDPLGHRRTWSYDARGNLLATTDPLGHTTRCRYDDRDLCVEVVDARGHAWRREYDARGNLVRTIDPLGATWELRRDARGRLVEARDPFGRGLQFTIDAAGQVVAVTDREGHTTRYAHDALGRLIRRVGPLGDATELHRDACGELVSIVEPDGARTCLERDATGNVVRRTDGSGRAWTFTYRGRGTLASQTDPLGGTIRYEHDGEENLVAVINELGERYTFEYDRRGLVTREVGFDGRTHLYRHDAAGRCVSIRNGRGQRTSIARDALGRLVEQVGSDGVRLRFGYDPAGDLVEAITEGCEVRLERDACGRVVREHAGGHTIETAYDPLGNRIRRATDLGHEALFDHDGNGDPIRLRVTPPGPPAPPDAPRLERRDRWEIEIERDAGGHEVVRRVPGGFESRWRRDLMGRPLEHRLLRRPGGFIPAWSEQSARAGAPEELSRTTYAWRAGDRLVAEHDDRRGATRYVHDARGALVAATDPDGATTHRAMDPAGNLHRSPDRSDRAYGPGGRLLAAGEVAFAYDADGTLARQAGPDGLVRAVEADSLGRVVRVTTARHEVVYSYDALGRRVTTTCDGATQRHLWSGHEEIGVIDGEVTAWEYVPGSFTPALAVRGERVEATISTRTSHVRVSPDARAPAETRLDVDGAPRPAEGEPWTFPGQRFDARTGLAYNRFRFFDPALGLYVSQDPLRIAGGPRLYGYVRDPLTWIDPLGLIVLFRGDRPGKRPDRIFSQGFEPRGRNPDLLAHTRCSKAAKSMYVPTSESVEVATRFAGKNGWVYVIDSERGIDVNHALGGLSPFPRELEHAMPGGIWPEEVVGAFRVKNGVLQPEFVANPGARPSEFSPSCAG